MQFLSNRESPCLCGTKYSSRAARYKGEFVQSRAQQVRPRSYMRFAVDLRTMHVRQKQLIKTKTKILSCLIAAIVGAFAIPLQAGESVVYSKNVAPAPPPELYGLGFYGAIDMGA